MKPILSQIPDGHVRRFLDFLAVAKTRVGSQFYAAFWPVGYKRPVGERDSESEVQFPELVREGR